MNNQITTKEIKSIDKRIKSCIIENPEEPNDEFYVKIWFNYRIAKKEVKTDGRQEFISKSKQKLIEEIQNFLIQDKNGWCIV